MAVLTIREIYDAARGAGFSPQQAVTWTSIAMAESRGRTSALNSKGEHSVGLWQINVASGVRSNKWGDLHDPENNARAAYEISRHGKDMRPWTTTHDHNKGTGADYRTYLGQVEREIGVKGDPRGVHGYHDTLPPPLPEEKTYDQIDNGKPLAETAAPAATTPAVADSPDTDHDGLTDAFEQLAGTNPKMADTDSDGLADGYEAMSSHTDPLSADTDDDGVSDPAELAMGSDAGRLPGVAGVVGQGVFAENVRHGVVDADADGLSDHTEKLVGTDAKRADTDGDGLSDGVEASLGTNPTLVDSDHDGLSDGLEVRGGSDPLGALRDTNGNLTPTQPWTLEGALAARSAASTEAKPAVAAADTGAKDPAEKSSLDVFLTEARAQRGDPYVYGAQPKLADDNPTSFDCSALTQWAANQAGVKIPRTAEYQYMELKQKHLLIPVDEALKTPGALLFYFSSEPTSSLPAGQAHVAISKGDGQTIEARGKAYGVGEFSAKNRFNFAGVIPGISDAKGLKQHQLVHAGAPEADTAGPETTAPVAGAEAVTGRSGFDIDPGARLATLPGAKGADRDTDRDGLTDAFEKLAGTNATRADTDGDGLNDGYEAATTHTDPLSGDTDGDGISDPSELAAGTDAGQLPGVAGVVGTGAYAENVRNGVTDTDLDGLSDHTEKLMGTKATVADTDADGLDDATEGALGTNPLLADTDADGISDGVEIQFQTDPLGAGTGQPALGGSLGGELGATPAAGGDPLTPAVPGVDGHGSAADAFDAG